MRSELFGANLEAGTQDRFALQNPRLLRIGLDGDVMARQGSMVAYQGELDFAYQGSGGMGRFLKKSLTGEGVPLMKVSGRGDLFLADDANEIHLITLEGDSITVNGRNARRWAGHSPDSSWPLSWDASVGRRRWPISCVCCSATRKRSCPCPATGITAAAAASTSAW
jgi:hypothetical protein